MTTWNPRAIELFLKALELGSAEERREYLDGACAGDAALRAEVETLLEANARAGSFLESPPAAPLPTVDESAVCERPGSVIGPYKLLEQIGEGGFGIVFMAEQTQPVRRKVALKILKPGMDTRQVIARFEAERQALALMDHPDIARVLDGGQTTTGRPYFVMDLVKGLSISEYCDAHRLTPRDRLELFIAVCQAVQHAHHKGIIHRDLKPSNVLVTVHDTMPVVKVIDFGVAKAMGQELTDKTLFTGLAQMLGTPLYMSPEQAGQSGLDIDTRSDIYSLGVLLYELLTGTTPFAKERLKEISFDELRRVIREEEPPKPSTRISKLGQAATTMSANRQSDPKRLRQLFSGDLDWIVMKCLEKDRNRRYETASALAGDVQRYLRDEPVQAGPPSRWYRFRKFARRNKRGLAMAAVVGLALLFAVGSTAGTIGWHLQAERGRHEQGVHEASVNVSEGQSFLKEGKRAEAMAALRRAEGVVAAGGLKDAELLAAVSQLRLDVETEARVEDARLARSVFRKGHLFFEGAEPAFLAAFQHYGLDMNEDASKLAARIQASAIRNPLVAALDEWAIEVKRDKAGRDKLLTVAKLADEDAWRRDFRHLIPQRNQKALKRLAANPEVLRQPPATIVLLARALAKADARSNAVELLRRAQADHPDDLWLNHELGLQLLNLRPPRAAEATGFLGAALALRPYNAGLHNNFAIALQKSGAVEAAEWHYRRAIELAEDYVEAYRNLGTLHHQRGKFQDALAAVDQVLQRQPKHPGAHCNRGDDLEELNRLEEAAEAFDKALQFQKETPEPDIRANAWLGLGIVRVKQEKWQEALVSLRRAQQFDAAFVGKGYEAHPEIPYYLGLALDNLGRPEEAIQAYHASLKLDPFSPSALVNLGKLFWAMKTKEGYVKAEELYRKAIALKRDSAKAWTNLGAVMNATSRYTEAIECYNEAVKYDPNDATTYYNLGNALRNSKRLPDAEKAFRKALSLHETYAEAHCNLGKVLRRQGRFKESLEYYRRGHDLGKKTPGWSYPSESWLKDSARLVELDGMFADIMRGEPPPAKPNDFFGVCEFALGWKKRPVTATQLYAQGLEKLAITGQFKSEQFYNGACAACLAATAKGQHALELDNKERGRLRGQALHWLRASLAMEKELSEKADDVQRAARLKRMDHWLVDVDLAALREPVALAKLPAADRDGCLRFWAEVLAFQAQLRPSP